MKGNTVPANAQINTIKYYHKSSFPAMDIYFCRVVKVTEGYTVIGQPAGLLL